MTSIELVPAIVSGLLSIISAAVVVGSTRQITKEHERRLNVNDLEHEHIESRINSIDYGVANLRGQLGMNGK